jgi:hypothetical protein
MDHGTPPYCIKYGFPSYEICPCCGYEFGNDDNPGTAEAVSFDDYRREWIASGAEWFESEAKRDGWNMEAQLTRAGIRQNERRD